MLVIKVLNVLTYANQHPLAQQLCLNMPGKESMCRTVADVDEIGRVGINTPAMTTRELVLFNLTINMFGI